MPLSRSRPLFLASQFFVIIYIFFGINSIFRPRSGYLLIGELPLPTTASDQATIDSLMVLYGAKDLFMAAALYVVGRTGDRRALGWMVIAGGAAALVDGWVVKERIGTGEWNHWGYGGFMVGLGGVLAGALD